MYEYKAVEMGTWGRGVTVKRVYPGQSIFVEEPFGEDELPAWLQPTAETAELLGLEAPDEDSGEVQVSEAARELAEVNSIPLEAIEGTGTNGAIIKKDVERVIAQTKQPAVAEGGGVGVGDKVDSASDVGTQ